MRKNRWTLKKAALYTVVIMLAFGSLAVADITNVRAGHRRWLQAFAMIFVVECLVWYRAIGAHRARKAETRPDSDAP